MRTFREIATNQSGVLYGPRLLRIQFPEPAEGIEIPKIRIRASGGTRPTCRRRRFCFPFTTPLVRESRAFYNPRNTAAAAVVSFTVSQHIHGQTK